MMKLSHEEYILKQREKVVRLASDVLNGELSILLASRQIVSLKSELNIDEDDNDILTFVTIESETDHLPIGTERKEWNSDALKDKDKEIQNCEEWAKEFGIDACKNIINRFST